MKNSNKYFPVRKGAGTGKLEAVIDQASSGNDEEEPDHVYRGNRHDDHASGNRLFPLQ